MGPSLPLFSFSNLSPQKKCFFEEGMAFNKRHPSTLKEEDFRICI